jgi:peptide deformylase
MKTGSVKTTMIKPIMKDSIFLAQKSAPATLLDLSVAQDLRDTLEAHRDGCVGMAANMIGVAKRIIIFDDNGNATIMFNPEIIKCSGAYEAEEGCLSLSGTRKAKRYRSIKVRYQNERFETRLKTYTGFTAQIIQHEIDHLGGVLI